MDEAQNPSNTPMAGEAYRLNPGPGYTRGQRHLAVLSYRLACIGPFAFLVMALLYPLEETQPLPSLSIQALWWTLCLCAPCSAALGAVVLLLFRGQTLGARKVRIDYAWAGLGIGVLASLALLLGIPILDDIRLANPRVDQGSVDCATKISQLQDSFMLYQQDYDGRYPPLESWNDAMSTYMKNDALHCPSTNEKLPTYAMNAGLKDTRADGIEMPERTVMLFDSIPGKNLVGGRELFPHPLRHDAGRTVTIGFVDGHVQTMVLHYTSRIQTINMVEQRFEIVPTEELSNVLWTPKRIANPGVSQPKQGENPSR